MTTVFQALAIAGIAVLTLATSAHAGGTVRVPEPATTSLLIAGGIGLALWKGRRRK